MPCFCIYDWGNWNIIILLSNLNLQVIYMVYIKQRTTDQKQTNSVAKKLLILQHFTWVV